MLRLEKEGKLHPRRDAKDRRVYRAVEVAALASERAAARGRLASGEVEAAILDQLDAGASDAAIVRALRVPFELVARVRLAAAGAPPIPAILPDEERALDVARAEIRARIEARRKARRQRSPTP